jgi:hypothetical protein
MATALVGVPVREAHAILRRRHRSIGWWCRLWERRISLAGMRLKGWIGHERQRRYGYTSMVRWLIRVFRLGRQGRSLRLRL